MKTLFIASTCLLLSFSVANATSVIYGPNKSASDLKRQANPYAAGNPYHGYYFYNPYSYHQNPYNQRSVRHNYKKYSHEVFNYNGKQYGRISLDVVDPQSMTNPYGKYGNPYNNKNPIRNRYDAQNSYNPYSSFRQSYNPNAVNNSAKYSRKIYDSNGRYIGRISNVPYHHDSMTNPYGKHGNGYSNYSNNNPYPEQYSAGGPER